MTNGLPQAPVSSNPARRIGKQADNLSNELTGLLFLIGTLECEVHGQSVNPWIRACRNFHTPETIRNVLRSGGSPRNPAPDDKQQCGEHNCGSRNIAEPRINRRRNRGWQAGIQDAFAANINPCDNTSLPIDHRCYTGVGCTTTMQLY